MLLANVAHIIIGRSGIRLWVQFVRIPKHVVLPTVIVLCVIGVYIPSNSMFHVALLFVFTALGYLMRKGGFSIVCLVIGFILGDDFEIALRQAILMNSNDYGVFLQSPIALFFFALTAFFIWHFGFRSNKKKPADGTPAGGAG